MWRKKSIDKELIFSFLKDLKTFQKLKEQRWEKIDSQVQMAITPGTPSEDWINPPDENNTLALLNQDKDYQILRTHLLKKGEEMKKCAQFIKFNPHYQLAAINFNSPLIGNVALEDGIKRVEEMAKAFERVNYLFLNLLKVLSFSKKES